MSQKLKCAIYARVSTDKQGDSIENQIGQAMEYISRNLGDIYDSEDVYIFKDTAQSGYYTSVFDRPAMKDAIEIAKTREFQLIIFKEISRVGRDKQENPAIIGMFEQYGVRVIAMNDNYDSANGDSITFDILSVLAEQESRKISARVSSAKKQKARRGQWNGEAPIGYKVDKETKKLIIDEGYSEIPKIIYDSYINKGLGTFKIAEYLNNKGLLTKKNNLWSRSTVKRILTNQVYLGHVVYGTRKNFLLREYDDSGKMTKKKVQIFTKPEEWLIIENAHEPIINIAEYNKAQEILSSRNKHKLPRRLNHPLTGVLVCGQCGIGMVAQKRTYKDKQYRYYICKTYHKYGRDACAQANINAEIIEEEVYDALLEEFQRRIANNPYDIEINKQEDIEKLKFNVKNIENKISKLQKDQKDLFNQRELFSDDLYKEQMIEIKQKIEVLVEEKEEIILKEKTLEKSKNEKRNFNEMLSEVNTTDLDNLNELKRIFRKYISNIKVLDNNTLEYNFDFFS